MIADPDVVIEKIALVDANINPCKGCNACERLNKCVQRDGMDIFHDKIIAADVILLSSPIYCMGIASQPKALIDRAQVFRSRKYVLKLPVVPPERKGKRLGIFLASAGQNWDHVFDGAFPAITAIFNGTGFEYYDNIIANNMDEFKGIINHPTALRDAFEKGQKVVGVIERMKTA
jgi:FMN-dependent NADH-azoreductase